MDGSSSPSDPNLALLRGLLKSRHKLHSYDQDRLINIGTINLILFKPQSFLQERRCERIAQHLQQYYLPHQASKEMHDLTQYYRYYHNSPMVSSGLLLELMVHYWSRKKTAYYRRIKRELQIEPDLSEPSQNRISETVGRSQPETDHFELPSQLCAQQPSFLYDPDTTLRQFLSALSTQAQFKEETREASRIGEFQDKSAKSQAKGRVASPGVTPSSKKQKRKSTHKSHSGDKGSPAKERTSYRDKKVTTMPNSQSRPDTMLNYQRRNKQIKQKQLKPPNHPLPYKNRQISGNKVRSGQKFESCPKQSGKHSEGRSLKRSEGGPSLKKAEGHSPNKAEGRCLKKEGKGSKKEGRGCKKEAGRMREAENTQVRAAIDRARDKIKAEKNLVMKKYMQERKSCTHSTDSRPRQSRQ